MKDSEYYHEDYKENSTQAASQSRHSCSPKEFCKRCNDYLLMIDDWQQQAGDRKNDSLLNVLVNDYDYIENINRFIRKGGKLTGKIINDIRHIMKGLYKKVYVELY